eukprot:TRINITY_DN24286_c0_g1_i4.p1 TRINITY_DN24286_c0_g1~~TRINITY_DN24286_c0_g1_i4.p1  ORF type:complete len:373 (+),score=71.28 TRINITY_DN24286_c0_g1_i4:111-1229(+)
MLRSLVGSEMCIRDSPPTTDPSAAQALPPATMNGAPPSQEPPPLNGTLLTLAPWSAVSLGPISPPCPFKNSNLASKFWVVKTEPGHQRTPPNVSDLRIYKSCNDAMGLALDTSARPACAAVTVPFAPGAFVITNLLSRHECAQFIAASEAVGYVPDEPITARERQFKLVAGTSAGASDRAANFTWLADPSLLDPLMKRCAHLMPQTLTDGTKFMGLNARWRLYRYRPGSVYRPHVDGAWPGSGVSPEGEYKYDAFGDQRSRFTFLIYLNEGFEGGATTFFTAHSDKLGTVNAQGVEPRTGTALVFPHGDGAGSLVHEGSALLSGAKYVVRTDAMYTLPVGSRKKKMHEEDKHEGRPGTKKAKVYPKKKKKKR